MPPRDADSSEGGTVILLVCGGVEVIRWPLAPQPRPDLALIDELARLQLMARRLGWHIRLWPVDPHLSELLTLTGLADMVTAESAERADRPGDPSGAPPSRSC
jgi:hypothetical protein